MASRSTVPKIYMRNKAGRQVEITPRYWTSRVWADYFKKIAVAAVLGLVAGGVVTYFN